MRRRLTTSVLAVFYLLEATWLLHAGADLVFPRLRVLAVAADACCARACGCPEEAQRNRTCCCSRFPAPAAAAPVPAPVRSIEEARCRGVEAAMAQAFTQPVVCSVAAVSLPSRAWAYAAAPESNPSPPPRAEALEKVPIAQA